MEGTALLACIPDTGRGEARGTLLCTCIHSTGSLSVCIPSTGGHWEGCSPGLGPLTSEAVLPTWICLGEVGGTGATRGTVLLTWIHITWGQRRTLGGCMYPTPVPDAGVLGSRGAVLSIGILGSREHKMCCQGGCRMQCWWAAHPCSLQSLLTAVCLSPPAAALSTDPTVLGKYRAGFSECMNEVTRFLSTCEGVNTEVRTRLLGHLASCMTQINAMNYPAPPPPPPLPPAAAFGPPLVPPGSGAGPLPGMPCKPGADTAKVYGGFQLLPASDGQFAFLIPSTAFAPGGAVLPLYGGPTTAATAASPPGPPPGTADSVWRPW